MKIGILGTGNVGSRLTALFTQGGHDVLMGGRSGEISLQDAAAHGDIVVVAVHYHVAAEVLRPLAVTLAGKIVVDATNPLNDEWSPMLLGQETSASEEIAKLLPQSKVVKAFNTIFADVMYPDAISRGGQNITAFAAGDDSEAVADVAALARDAGFAPVAITKLSAARYLEAMAHLNIELAVGQGGGTNAAFLYHRA
ncbi:NADP oxidoreductase [Leisingera sp. ANG-M1]|uniref:NADPH-dependent F420 reductase n=1 Tax=Leisingera sp. ANG-M1 TaxID=1577895 RepID=UPI00057F1D6F|nr:NAD(P)-binding domain-containing protein [Leisingera sp. ANG-M1]KIC08532.1 NADP oxidoreductase [Leisingera sp. ANG-M1]